MARKISVATYVFCYAISLRGDAKRFFHFRGRMTISSPVSMSFSGFDSAGKYQTLAFIHNSNARPTLLLFTTVLVMSPNLGVSLQYDKV